MRGVTNSLSARLRANGDELDRRLAHRQLFPHPDDGPKTREIMREITAYEMAIDVAEDGDFDERSVARMRLKQWRKLVKSRYEDWRAANGS